MEEGTGFEVRITQAGGNEIYLDDKAVSSVEFFVDTIDENVKDRSEDVVNKVIVTGKLSEENKTATRDLLKWSLATKSGEVYRSAEITIRINKTTQVRIYKMDKVFCLDYREKFVNGANDSEFELKFSQRKDNMESIKVIC